MQSPTVSKEDEKHKTFFQMKRILHSIFPSSSDAAYAVLLFTVIFSIAFFISYFLCQDDTRTAITFSAYWAVFVVAAAIHRCILYIKSDYNSDIRRVLTAIGFVSFFTLIGGIGPIFFQEDAHFIDRIVKSAAGLSCFCLSLWAYISIACAKKYTTILTVTSLIFFIFIIPLYYGSYTINFLFDYSATGDILKVLNSYNIGQINDFLTGTLFPTVMVAGCIKGLIITFSRAWREQFTNQRYPFTIIFIVTLCFTLIMLYYFSIFFDTLNIIKEYIHHILL